ncbi:hypothetical protein BUALT_BualtUnG0017100 [Buddleja alternifolia]|uniref:Uncharacterized protein n=1 Tax=Buddleja alternifolia TaxID=168488 RepID=A0AAV6W071_9LAMI|nr:hypothetical protein BUALT_BualtUnG0017100 [Buddleja alternifolia]
MARKREKRATGINLSPNSIENVHHHTPKSMKGSIRPKLQSEEEIVAEIDVEDLHHNEMTKRFMATQANFPSSSSIATIIDQFPADKHSRTTTANSTNANIHADTVATPHHPAVSHRHRLLAPPIRHTAPLSSFVASLLPRITNSHHILFLRFLRRSTGVCCADFRSAEGSNEEF